MFQNIILDSIGCQCHFQSLCTLHKIYISDSIMLDSPIVLTSHGYCIWSSDRSVYSDLCYIKNKKLLRIQSHIGGIIYLMMLLCPMHSLSRLW